MWEYFDGCTGLIGYASEDRGKVLNVEVKTPMFERDGLLNPTNDRITYLFADDLLIALGIETRTVFNFIDAVFVCMLTNGKLFFLRDLYDIHKGKSGRERVYSENLVIDPPSLGKINNYFS
jgi:hypothetical protein